MYLDSEGTIYTKTDLIFRTSVSDPDPVGSLSFSRIRIRVAPKINLFKKWLIGLYKGLLQKVHIFLLHFGIYNKYSL